jgi:hypothetical protein
MSHGGAGFLRLNFANGVRHVIRGVVVRVVGQVPGQQLVQNHSKGVNVGCGGDQPAAKLFRAGKLRRQAPSTKSLPSLGPFHDGRFLVGNHSTPACLAGRRSACARETYAGGLPGITSHGAALHGPRKRRAHAADHGFDQRSLLTSGQREGSEVAATGRIFLRSRRS